LVGEPPASNTANTRVLHLVWDSHVADLDIHFEKCTTLIPPNFDPDLVLTVHCHDPLLVWVPANDRMAEQTFTDNLGAGKGEEQGREMGEEGDEEGKE